MAMRGQGSEELQIACGPESKKGWERSASKSFKLITASKHLWLGRAWCSFASQDAKAWQDMTRYEKHSESAADLLSFQVLQGQKWHQEVKSSLARAPHPHFQRPCWGRYGEIAALGAIGVSKVYTNKFQRMKHECVKAPTSCFARHLKILMFPMFLHRPTCEMRIAKGSPDIRVFFVPCQGKLPTRQALEGFMEEVMVSPSDCTENAGSSTARECELWF